MKDQSDEFYKDIEFLEWTNNGGLWYTILRG